ncbi:MAG: AraC family transcriptional regulator [Burkholderiaceae bacterium]|nr:AraC family transcriptional regulator [Burkholderiaceae bacterium]
MSILIRAAAFTNYLAVAQRLGLDPDIQLQQVGLSRRDIAHPEMRVEGEALVALLEQSAAASGDITFALKMAETRKASNMGALSLILVHVSTLRRALDNLIQFNHMWNPALTIESENARGKTIYRFGCLTKYGCAPRQAIELTVGVVCRLGHELAGEAGMPDAVHFVHQAPPDVYEHERFFGVPVRFGSSFNGLVYSDAALDRNRTGSNSVLADHALGLVAALPGNRADSFVVDVRKAIHLGLPVGRATIELTARRLGMPVRTLQHQLKRENLVFSDLVNEERRLAAKSHLDNPSLSLSQIATLLGYSSHASFTHWFSAQYGMSPSQWRKGSAERLAA